jgi:hypothetical protein
MSLSRENVYWVYKNILGREPENDTVVLNLMNNHSTRVDLIMDIISSEEYRLRSGIDKPEGR